MARAGAGLFPVVHGENSPARPCRLRLLHDERGLVGVVGAVCRDRDEAVQDAFVRLMGGWSKLPWHDDPEAWVRKVALRQVGNRRRKTLNSVKAALRHGPPPVVPEPNAVAVDANRPVPYPITLLVLVAVALADAASVGCESRQLE